MKGADPQIYTQQFKLLRSMGEYELVHAVLVQAILDAEMGCIPTRNSVVQRLRMLAAEDAIVWFKDSPAPGSDEFIWSLPWICETLGLCAVSIKREILRRCGGKIAEVRRRWNERKDKHDESYMDGIIDELIDSVPDRREHRKYVGSGRLLGGKKQPRVASAKRKIAARKAESRSEDGNRRA
jgi:hypothetical protein